MAILNLPVDFRSDQQGDKNLQWSLTQPVIYEPASKTDAGHCYSSSSPIRRSSTTACERPLTPSFCMAFDM